MSSLAFDVFFDRIGAQPNPMLAPAKGRLGAWKDGKHETVCCTLRRVRCSCALMRIVKKNGEAAVYRFSILRTSWPSRSSHTRASSE